MRGNGYEKQNSMRQGVLVDGMFPSPCGEMVMKNLRRLLSTLEKMIRVSVPLRGNGYEKLTISGADQAEYNGTVSVPLRGNGYEKLG